MPNTIITLYSIIIGGLVVGEIQNYLHEIEQYLASKSKKRSKSEAQKFYSSTPWRKARQECFRLQMVRTGNGYIECEICGSTSMDLDDSGRKIVMSVGHDKARSTHQHLALEQNNLFPQCMPCNLGQGTDQRIR